MMLRAFALTLALALTASCGAKPARSSAPAAPAIEAPAAELLPAGIYWRDYQVCSRCPPPAFATAAIAATAEKARAVVAGAPDGLPLGYPMVAHGDQLGRPGKLLVIFGLHADQAGADAWLAYQKARGLDTAEIPIDGGSEPPLVEKPSVVSRLIAGAPIAAFDRDEVIEAETAAYQAGRWPDPEAIAAGLEPACTLPSGSLFVTPQTEHEWERRGPVRCGGEPALVPWRQSLLGSATVIRRRGGYVLRQVTAVDCDTPTFSEWRYSREGKSGEPVVQTGGGDC